MYRHQGQCSPERSFLCDLLARSFLLFSVVTEDSLPSSLVFVVVCLSSEALDSPLCYCFALGLGLLYLGTRDACEATLTALEALATFSPDGGNSPNLSAQILAAYAQLTVEGMAYAGSGDVLKAQKFLSVCAETRDKKYWSSLFSRSSGEEGAEGASGPSEAKTDGEISAEGEGTGGDGKKEKNGSDGRRRASLEGGSGSSSHREKKSSGGESSAGAGDGNKGGPRGAGGSEEEDDEDEEDSRKLDQAVAVMNVALLSFAEDVGAEMSLRMMVCMQRDRAVEARA